MEPRDKELTDYLRCFSTDRTCGDCWMNINHVGLRISRSNITIGNRQEVGPAGHGAANPQPLHQGCSLRLWVRTFFSQEFETHFLASPFVDPVSPALLVLCSQPSFFWSAQVQVPVLEPHKIITLQLILTIFAMAPHLLCPVKGCAVDRCDPMSPTDYLVLSPASSKSITCPPASDQTSRTSERHTPRA